MKFNTIRFKISILYTLILGGIFVIYTTFLYITMSKTLYNDFDCKLSQQLKQVKENIISNLENTPNNDGALIYSVWKTIDLNYDYDGYIIFMNAEGEPLVRSLEIKKELLQLVSENSKRPASKWPAYRDIVYKNETFRFIVSTFSYKEEEYHIYVGASLKHMFSFFKERLYYRLIPTPFIILFGLIIGRFFTKRILKPVVEVTRTAKSITYKDLSARVKTENIDEEMRYLVDSFNDMISRLEKSFNYVSEFSSYVAHELKTPLTIIKGESELALLKQREPEEYRRVIKVNLEEAERMFRIIEDLFLLTRLEYHPETLKLEHFNFIDFFEEIHGQSKLLALSKNITVRITSHNKSFGIYANKLYLRRLFFNLIDNAIKFTSENGVIDIKVENDGKHALVSISDNGVGITDEDLPRIFDKFFHVDRRGEAEQCGSGLGLSIAKSIAKIHRGEIEVRSKPRKGTTFTVRLPIVV